MAVLGSPRRRPDRNFCNAAISGQRSHGVGRHSALGPARKEFHSDTAIAALSEGMMSCTVVVAW